MLAVCVMVKGEELSNVRRAIEKEEKSFLVIYFSSKS